MALIAVAIWIACVVGAMALGRYPQKYTSEEWSFVMLVGMTSWLWGIPVAVIITMVIETLLRVLGVEVPT